MPKNDGGVTLRPVKGSKGLFVVDFERNPEQEQRELQKIVEEAERRKKNRGQGDKG